MSGADFSGFSKDTVRFFTELRRNNNRDWFEAHRAAYETEVMEPAKAFVTAMGARLRSICPRILAVPKVNKSIFRLNRDARFSLDPSPYKTNLGLYFWEGGQSRMEASGFYFHLEPPNLLLGVGIYIVPSQLLARYRRAVADPKKGKKLGRIVALISRLKGSTLGGKHYKRVPAGFDHSHPNAELLKHTGLYAGFETRIPPDFFSARLLDYCYQRFKAAAPLHRWLVRNLWD
jgi:uncharacterized protein (TIGR02453 family)